MAEAFPQGEDDSCERNRFLKLDQTGFSQVQGHPDDLQSGGGRVRQEVGHVRNGKRLIVVRRKVQAVNQSGKS